MRDRDKVSAGEGDVDGCSMACTGLSRDTECSLGARVLLRREPNCNCIA